MSLNNRKNYSRTSPNTNQRACLCQDGNTYSRDCCKGNMINQGVGNVTGHSFLGNENFFRVLKCGTGIKKDIHVHDASLIISNTYYLEFLDSGSNGCYEVIDEPANSGLHVENFTLYSNCSDCLSYS